VNTPDSIKSHEDKYVAGAWTQYTLEELGQWVSLFSKRAGHRSVKEKAEKDLADAQNYLNMAQEQLNAIRTEILDRFGGE